MTAAKQFKGFIDRIEALHAERQAIAADISSVYKEAREARFDVKTMKALIAERQREQRDPTGFKSAMELLEEYRELLLGTGIALHARARDIPPHDEITGEILESGAPLPAAPVAPGPAEGTAAAPDTDPPAVCPIREDGRPDAIRTSDPGTSTAGGLSPTAAAIGATFMRPAPPVTEVEFDAMARAHRRVRIA